MRGTGAHRAGGIPSSGEKEARTEDQPGGAAAVAARKDDPRLQLLYERTPRRLIPGGSIYKQVLFRHMATSGELSPDAVILEQRGSLERWLVIEMEMSFSGPL
jgi:hypothetical protein